MGRPGRRGKSTAADRRLKQLGNAAHLLGIRPWEWALLTVDETDEVLAWLDSYRDEIEKAESAGRR